MAKLSIKEQVSQRTGTEDSREVSLSIKDIPIGEITIKDNIRKEYNEINELKISIQQYGLLQPITVYRDGDKYAVKTGHRRYLAYRELYREMPDQFHSIRCIISDDADIQIIQLIENVQRADLSERELYDALRALRETGYTHMQIANIMGKSEAYIKNLFVGINEIESNEILQKVISSAGATIMDIKETKGITDEQARLYLLNRHKNGQMTRAELRKQVKRLKEEPEMPTAVQIVYNEKKRTLTVSFNDENIPVSDIIEDLKAVLTKRNITY